MTTPAQARNDAALQLAPARGYDLVVLTELLPVAEAGLVEALRSGEASKLMTRKSSAK